MHVTIAAGARIETKVAVSMVTRGTSNRSSSTFTYDGRYCNTSRSSSGRCSITHSRSDNNSDGTLCSSRSSRKPTQQPQMLQHQASGRWGSHSVKGAVNPGMPIPTVLLQYTHSIISPPRIHKQNTHSPGTTFESSQLLRQAPSPYSNSPSAPPDKRITSAEDWVAVAHFTLPGESSTFRTFRISAGRNSVGKASMCSE